MKQLIRRSSKFNSREAIHEQPLDYGFPKLTQTELEIFCCGTYQLKMANSYYAEHIKTNGRYKFFIDKDGCDLDYEGAGITFPKESLQLIKTGLFSRHSAAVKHHQFVLLNKSKEGIQMLEEYYCTCKVGMRTIGCCAHVATVVWYFCHACHLPSIHLPAQSLSAILKKAATLPTLENVDESDLEESLDVWMPIECQIELFEEGKEETPSEELNETEDTQTE